MIANERLVVVGEENTPMMVFLYGNTPSPLAPFKDDYISVRIGNAEIVQVSDAPDRFRISLHCVHEGVIHHSNHQVMKYCTFFQFLCRQVACFFHFEVALPLRNLADFQKALQLYMVSSLRFEVERVRFIIVRIWCSPIDQVEADAKEAATVFVSIIPGGHKGEQFQNRSTTTTTPLYTRLSTSLPAKAGLTVEDIIKGDAVDAGYPSFDIVTLTDQKMLFNFCVALARAMCPFLASLKNVEKQRLYGFAYSSFAKCKLYLSNYNQPQFTHSTSLL